MLYRYVAYVLRMFTHHTLRVLHAGVLLQLEVHLQLHLARALLCTIDSLHALMSDTICDPTS